MTDIKTRDVTRGTIKTIDRAASSMHHLKEETIRSKAAEIGSRSDNESSSSYAINSVEHRMKVGSEHAMETGIKSIYHAFREQGTKRIQSQRESSKLADNEVISKGEVLRNAQKAVAGRQNPIALVKGTASITETSVGEARVQGKMRAHAIKSIADRDAKNAGLLRRLTSGKRGRSLARGRAGRGLKDILGGSKTLSKSVIAGAAVAVGMVVVMTIFGSALNMTEDGNYISGTGDGAIVEVAQAQIGNVGGDKFWKWYGFSSRVDWCAIFVSWCGEQCGYLKQGVLPKFAMVGDGAGWFKARHRWAARGYTPKPGDIIFFDYGIDGELDHVGIVESSDGRIVTTIEGNSSDKCKRNRYTVGNPQIAGYGLMVQLGEAGKPADSQEKEPTE